MIVVEMPLLLRLVCHSRTAWGAVEDTGPSSVDLVLVWHLRLVVAGVRDASLPAHYPYAMCHCHELSSRACPPSQQSPCIQSAMTHPELQYYHDNVSQLNRALAFDHLTHPDGRTRNLSSSATASMRTVLLVQCWGGSFIACGEAAVLHMLTLRCCGVVGLSTYETGSPTGPR